MRIQSGAFRTLTRTRYLLAVPVAVALMLSSCDFFSYSIFPESLTVVDGSVDLSGYMHTLNSSQTVVDAFDDGTREYVFLLQGEVSTVHLVVIDGDLTVKYSGDDPRFGRFQVVDRTSQFDVVGQMEFNPLLDPITFIPTNLNVSSAPYPIDRNTVGFDDGTYYNFLSIDSPDLDSSRYSNWTVTATNLALLISSGTDWFNDVRRASWDPTTDAVSLVINSDVGFYIFRFARTSFGSLSQSPSLFDNYPPSFVGQSNGGEQVAATPNGYVVLSQNGPSPSLEYTSTVDGSTSSLTLQRVVDGRLAASPDGSYVYVLSIGDKKLFRYRRWW